MGIVATYQIACGMHANRDVSHAVAGATRRYDVAYDGNERLDVTFVAEAGTGDTWLVDFETADFISAVMWRSAASQRSGLAKKRETDHSTTWNLHGCATPCRVSYKVDLRAASAQLSHAHERSLPGTALVTSGSVWLMREELPAHPGQAEIHLRSPSKAVTGMPPAASGADTFVLTYDDLFTAPYTAFGAMRVQRPKAPAPALTIALSGEFALGDAAIIQMIERNAGWVAAYFGKRPGFQCMVLAVAENSDELSFGMSLSGGGASVILYIGNRISETTLSRAWVPTHEMIHTMTPAQPPGRRWIEEGLATYLEPVIRVRVGNLGQEEAWRDLLKGLPQGLPTSEQGGLDGTRDWGRTYWGGALFWFTADVEIRSRTAGRKTVQDALRAIAEQGGNNGVRLDAETMFAIADRALGTPVLVPMLREWGTHAVDQDLNALYAQLGVRLVHERVVFDDTAALAGLRRQLMAPVIHP